MKEWQFNVAFVVAILGAVVMLFADPLKINVSPGVITIYAGLLAFIYQSRDRGDDDDDDDRPKGGARKREKS
jgi:hypothetical protein